MYPLRCRRLSADFCFAEATEPELGLSLRLQAAFFCRILCRSLFVKKPKRVFVNKKSRVSTKTLFVRNSRYVVGCIVQFCLPGFSHEAYKVFSKLTTCLWHFILSREPKQYTGMWDGELGYPKFFATCRSLVAGPSLLLFEFF